MKTMIDLLTAKNRVLFVGLSAVSMVCLLILGLFDIDRGTELISIVTNNKTIVEELLYFGFVWCSLAFVDFYLLLSHQYNRIIMWYRMLLITFVPVYIAIRVVFFPIELFSVDIAMFILIPLCQITLLIACEFEYQYRPDFKPYDDIF